MRTDIHSPKNFDPQAYDYIGIAFSGDSSLPPFMPESIETFIEQNPHGVPNRSLYQCDHCGAWHKYTTIFQHENGEWVSVGQDCAEGRFTMPDRATFEAARLRSSMAAKRAAAKKSAALSEYFDANPEMGEAFEWADDLGSQIHRLRADVNDALDNYGDWTPEAVELNKELKALERLVGYNTQVITEIQGSLYRYGSISEKQEAFVKRLHGEGMEKLSKAKEIAEKVAALTPLKEGRYEVTGSIVSTKTYENDYGVTHKMLVQVDEDHRAFGTIPSSILDDWFAPLEDLKGRTVTFTARFENKDNDFAIFSRPTKASLKEDEQ